MANKFLFYSFLKFTDMYSVLYWCFKKKIDSLELTVLIVSLANSQGKATMMGFMLSKVYQQAYQISKIVTGCL